MKYSILVFLVLSFNSLAFAQESTSSDKMPYMKTNQIFVSAEYMNLTDLSARAESTSSRGTDSYNFKSGTSLGTAGVSVGYQILPETGVGARMGLRIMQSFIKSEAPEKVTFYIPEVNITYSFSELFSIYGGGNLSFWRGNEFYNKSQTGLGLQAGINFRFNSSLNLTLGSTTISSVFKDEYTSYYNGSGTTKTQVTIYASGFHTGLAYTF